MRSLSGSSLTTFLMLLPLIAVPLLAIFGIPEFSSVNASPSGEVIAPGGFSVTDRTTPAAQSAGKPVADLFSPLEKGAANIAGNNTAVTRREDPFQTSGNSKATMKSNPDESVAARQMRGWVVDLNRSEKRSESNQPFMQRSSDTRPFVSARQDKPQSFAEYLQNRGELKDDKSSRLGSYAALPNSSRSNRDGSLRRNTSVSPRKTVSAGRLATGENSTVIRGNNSPRDPLTWQSAVRRLNDLGIHDFRLQPGRDATLFHFSCRFAPESGGRVTHLFEAEASEPLRAVENVLRQIETWLSRRS